MDKLKVLLKLFKVFIVHMLESLFLAFLEASFIFASWFTTCSLGATQRNDSRCIFLDLFKIKEPFGPGSFRKLSLLVSGCGQALELVPPAGGAPGLSLGKHDDRTVGRVCGPTRVCIPQEEPSQPISR